ncbi:DNA polymerase III subunit delta [Sphaerochaeta sp. PS]|uniref:DNA polymerase III subunit delta n=1 Tax=Sphaerochaeta sp. PS TaxID=3076336 RepID=UPI0028A4D953|nr:DNA polymerase III subunit delta [Sphaerochaeta sp. PS]MDT4761864.1 DNA polymerase III subunit delta [Sphaerochaeta sp. PS]
MTARAYLLLGPETGEKELMLKEIRNSLKKETGDELEMHRFYPFETENGEILVALNNNSLFSDHRLVILSQAENLSASMTASLADYLAHPCDTATLVIISAENSLSAKLMKAVPKDNTKIFYELFENQKFDWVRNFFQKYGLVITSEAIDSLLSLVENNTQELRTIASQLTLFWQTGDKNRPITEEDIQTYIHHSRQEDAFTLFPFIAKRDLKQSIASLHAILGSGDSSAGILLVSGLLWQFRRLLSIKTLMQDGLSEYDAFNGANVLGKGSPIRNPRDKGVYHQAVINYSLDECRAIITVCADADLESKEAGSEMLPLMLERMLYRIISAKGRKLTTVNFASL